MTKRAKVTDHAVLRYLERVWGVDIDAVRKRISRTVQTGIDHDADGLRVGNISYKIRNGKVTTVVPSCEPSRATRVRFPSKKPRK